MADAATCSCFELFAFAFAFAVCGVGEASSAATKVGFHANAYEVFIIRASMHDRY